MVLIKTKKGLDIPLEGKPLQMKESISSSSHIGFDLSRFASTKLKLLKKENDFVAMGEAIAVDKEVDKRHFVSFVSGKVVKIIRGEKRRLLTVVIEKSDDVKRLDNIDPSQLKCDALIDILCQRGAFAYLRKRPCNTLADPQQKPRSIFVQAIDSAPFSPPAPLYVEGNEAFLQTGLRALEKMACGNVHIVMDPNSPIANFCDNVTLHSHVAMGPHPVSSPSLHIEKIDPIVASDDIVWTIHIADVILIGALLMGEANPPCLIGMGGEGIVDEARGFYWVQRGSQIGHLVEGKKSDISCRFIRGNPICGTETSESEFLGLQDRVLALVPNESKRKWIHFCRPGLSRYTSSRTYISTLLKRTFSFNTQLHGEKRAFVDGHYYDKVMPLDVPTMPLLKALLAKDYDLAVELGLLEIEEEDFALTSFVCPSKIDHISIVRKGLQEYASLYLN